MWLPTDLASASDVNADAIHATPLCARLTCTFGSNALQLTWNDGSGETTVSYRYGPAAWRYVVHPHARRVQGRCVLVAGRLARSVRTGRRSTETPCRGPPEIDVPNEVIDVTVPLDVIATTPGGADRRIRRSAQRVIVNVNGAPGVDGTDRSSSVSFTAGGSSFGDTRRRPRSRTRRSSRPTVVVGAR